jgi:hypothetical protein
MVSTTNVYENTEMPMCGKFSLSYSTIYPWLQSLRTKFSVSTVDSPPVLTLLIKFASLTEFKKYLTRAQFAIYYGQIQMIVVVGVFLPEVLVIVLDKIFQSSSITQMD